MKICYIGWAGNAIIRRWAKWFADNGHEIHIISPHEPISEISDELKKLHIHNLDIDNSVLNLKILPYKSSWLPIYPSRKIIKEINPDIVHAYDVVYFGLPTVFSGNYPKIVSLMGSLCLALNQPEVSVIYKLLIKFVAKRVDRIHSFSDNLTDELALFGVNKKKIITITPAVDTKNFNLDTDNYQIKRSLGLEDNSIIISIRNLAPWYNIGCLVNAIPFVVNKIAGAKFIIKMGHIIHKDHENEIKNLAEELGVSDRVKFISYVKYDDLPKYLACADVYVSTSLLDGLGISNVEALACGTPAVLADIDSTRNLIKKGLYARLYPPKDSKALAKEIIASIKNSEKENKEIHKENFKIIKEHYDFDKNMEKIEQLYEDLIKKHKK